MLSQPFDPLRRELLRKGVSPRYIRRYIAELSDHRHMLVEENRSAGRTLEEATLQARGQLGDEAELLRSVLERRAVFALARRRPGIVFALCPIPALYATKFLILLFGVSVTLLLRRCADVSTGWTNSLRTLMHFCLDYGAPLAVAALYCTLAYRRGCRPVWPVLSSLLLGLAAGCVHFEMRQPMFHMDFVQAGTGVFSLTVTPVLLVPLAVCGVFEVFRLRQRLAAA